MTIRGRGRGSIGSGGGRQLKGNATPKHTDMSDEATSPLKLQQEEAHTTLKIKKSEPLIMLRPPKLQPQKPLLPLREVRKNLNTQRQQLPKEVRATLSSQQQQHPQKKVRTTVSSQQQQHPPKEVRATLSSQQQQQPETILGTDTMAQQSRIEVQNLVGTRQNLVPQAPQHKDGQGQAHQQRLLEKVQEEHRDQGQAQQQRECQVQEQNRGSISGPSSEASCIDKERRVRGKYKCYQVDMKTKGGKLKITIPDDMLRPVKDNARDVVNFCGFIVRSLAPLDVDTWQEVVAAVGTQMMKQVKEKFMADPHNEFRFDAFILSTMQRLYRCWKNRLHMIYKKYNNDEERMTNIPDDVTPEAWKKLMDHFSSLEFQKVSQRNSKNRSKLTTKHTCGTRSYAEVEEMTRDPITGEKAPPDEVWLKQHTKMTDVGEVRWSDPKSKEIHEQLHQVVIEQTNVDEGEQMTRDEILLHVLGEKSGYFRGKGAGKKVPTKRGRQMEDVNEQVQRAIDRAKEDMMGQFTESMLEKVREEVRSEVRAEVRAEIQEELKTEIQAQLQLDFDNMFQERMAAFLGSISQSRS